MPGQHRLAAQHLTVDARSSDSLVSPSVSRSAAARSNCSTTLPTDRDWRRAVSLLRHREDRARRRHFIQLVEEAAIVADCSAGSVTKSRTISLARCTDSAPRLCLSSRMSC